jgi:hypothetical protein
MAHSYQSIARVWGATAVEQAMPYPCDEYLPDAEQSYFRAVDVWAPAPMLFRWLCQMKVAPYSYDWIDNLGRRSPRQLTAGLERLAPGQRVMEIFELVAYEQDRHLTLLLTKPRARAIFGAIAGSYVVIPQAERSCRLVVKLAVRYPRGFWSWMRWFLPWGDLLMMRKQLLTLKQLAESDSKP